MRKPGAYRLANGHRVAFPVRRNRQDSPGRLVVRILPGEYDGRVFSLLSCTGFPSNELLQKYKKATGSKIKVITQVSAGVTDESTLYDNLFKAIDFGVDIIQIQGNFVDWMVRDRHIDRIGKLLQKIREEGFTAGLGSHTVDSMIACEQNGIIPDYYMKTMHHVSNSPGRQYLPRYAPEDTNRALPPAGVVQLGVLFKPLLKSVLLQPD